MLVIISDTHLTDGSSGETIDGEAFWIFVERLRDLACYASSRADKSYKPIEEFDLVLLGDILDVIRSATWLEKEVRPWSSVEDPAFASAVGTITDAILAKNSAFIGYVRGLSDPSSPYSIRIPRERNGLETAPIKVRVHYIIGNHDWFYHLPGGPFNAIRRKIVDAMGLANDPARPFPYDVDSCPGLTDVCRRHAVFARHGDFYDGLNFERERNASSLGDALVVELVDRFPAEVEKQLGGKLEGLEGKKFLQQLRDIDNVRPMWDVSRWVDGLLRRFGAGSWLEWEVKGIWNRMVDDFLRLQFVRNHDKWCHVMEPVDKLAAVLRLSRAVDIRAIDQLVTWYQELKGFFGHGDENFYKHALDEQAFKDRRARYIVYGHTHRHEIIPLERRIQDGRELEQVYLNSGTWRQVYELAQSHREKHQFIGHKVMTYLAFFADGERGGRTFEAWSGALGAAS